jgi:hypothetical protein
MSSARIQLSVTAKQEHRKGMQMNEEQKQKREEVKRELSNMCLKLDVLCDELDATQLGSISFALHMLRRKAAKIHVDIIKERI